MVADCLFCRLARGEVPAAVVRRTERLMAFRDITPQAPVHLLVIPIQHVASLDQAEDPALLGEMLHFAAEVARETDIAGPGYRVVVNTNAQGGQTVPHLHLHVLGGRFMTWPPG
jgi:histidine triad (HIT) family protein